MIKKLTNILTLLIPTSFAFSISVSNTKFAEENDHNITNALKKQLRQEIINNSEKISTKQYLQYDTKNFENDEQLNQYLAKKNEITKIITTSNLGKIIKDYEFKLLNEEKIYSVNIDDYKMIYKDRNGVAVLDKKQALRSYNSDIEIKGRYSYSADNWHDSQTEAEEKKKKWCKKFFIYLLK